MANPVVMDRDLNIMCNTWDNVLIMQYIYVYKKSPYSTEITQ